MRGPKAGAVVAAAVLVSGGCGPAAPAAKPGPAPMTGFGRIELEQRAAAPRLTLVVRDGDPFPALVATIATGHGAAATVALGTVLEGRLAKGGVAAQVVFDRSALHVELPAATPAASLAALASALRAPVQPSELGNVARRMEALARLPLPADELAPYASCTGQLALAPSERDSAKPPPVSMVEATRAQLSLDALSLAAVGPGAYAAEVSKALESTRGWPSPPRDGAARSFRVAPPAQAEGARVYHPPTLERGVVLLHASVRVGSAERAAYAARRLGGAGSILSGRLGSAWELVEIVGAAQPWGGCVAITLRGPTSQAALAAAVTDEELRVELAETPPPAFAARIVLEATHPREAAMRAAWWSLAGPAPSDAKRATSKDAASLERPAWVIGAIRGEDRGLRDALAEALGREKQLEVRTRVELGQAELWLLLASPCGAQPETPRAAGTTALSLLASVPPSVDDVALEPWLSPHGLGVLAHAAPKPGEDAAGLAKRVGAAAGRGLFAGTIDGRSLEDARAKALTSTERLWAGEPALGAALAEELSPDAPSRVVALPSFDAAAKLDVTNARAALAELRALPVRAAVLANVDETQAQGALTAAKRFVSPLRSGPCRPVSRAPRAGTVTASARSKSNGTALLAVPLPGGLDLGPAPAAFAAWLGADGGAVAKRAASDGGSVEVRWLAGEGQGALVLTLRAPAAELAKVASGAREALAQALKAPATPDLDAAFAKQSASWTDSRAEPRARLLDAFVGPPSQAKPADWASWARAVSDPAKWVGVEPR